MGDDSIDMVIHDIYMIDDSIDMVIHNIYTGYLVTLAYRASPARECCATWTVPLAFCVSKLDPAGPGCSGAR